MIPVLVFDVVLIAVLAGFLVSGLGQGLARSLGAILGLVAGGVAAFFLMPFLAGIVPWPFWRMFFIVVSAVLLLAGGHGIGSAIGRVVGRRVDKTALRPVDRLLGGAATLVTSALVIALVAGGLPALGAPVLSLAAAQSNVLRIITAVTPEPVDAALARLRSAVLAEGLPSIRDALGGIRISPGAPDDLDTTTDPLRLAAASVVRISGTAFACGQNQSGSGFVIAPDRVVTNAHVIAGVEQPLVEAPNGQVVAGRVVSFDPELDLAVIATNGLQVEPLETGERLETGEEAVIDGYPYGGPFSSEPAEVLAVSTERIRDIYGDGAHEREVYVLAAVVNPGNSGGPVIALDGDVAGVVFAKGTGEDELGYAVTTTELEPLATAAPGLSSPVSPGACVPN